jgi:tetratricopeptide (TPR) repeat protein
LLFASTIILKSGKKVDGKILEETQDYIKIDYQGMPIYYERVYIQEILREDSVPVKEELKAPSEGEVDHLKKGLEFGSEGNFTEAEAAIEKGLSINPDDYNLRGAKSVFDEMRAGKISQEYAQNLFKGSLFLMDEKYEQAIVALKKALEINPKDSDVNYNLALAYYSLGDYNQAILYFLETSKLLPNDGVTYSLLGNAYYLAGQPQKAKESLTKAKELFVSVNDEENAQEVSRLLNTLP